MSNQPLFMKPKELFPYYGVCDHTIYRMLHKGLIPGAFKAGRSWYINKRTFLSSIENASSNGQKPKGISRDPNSGRHGIG